MNSSLVQINCYVNSYVDWLQVAVAAIDFNKFRDHLTKLEEYKATKIDESNFVVDLFIDDVNMRLNVTCDRSTKDIDVCLVGGYIGWNLFAGDVKRDASACKQFHPTSPIVIAGHDADAKYEPGKLKEADLGGWKIFNQQMGNQLANEIGAVKYLEYSGKTGRGGKQLIDEIVYAGLGNLKVKNKRKGKSLKCQLL